MSFPKLLCGSPVHASRIAIVFFFAFHFVTATYGQSNPFDDAAAPQSAPAANPFSTVPSSPSPATEQPESGFSNTVPVDLPATIRSPFDAVAPTSTPDAAVPADPFAQVQPTESDVPQTPSTEPSATEPSATEPSATEPSATEPSATQAIPETSAAPNPFDTPVSPGTEGSNITDSETGEPLSEGEESTTSNAADAQVTNVPPQISKPIAPSVWSTISPYWPYLAGLLAVLLLWPLSKLLFGKKKIPHQIQEARAVDPAKSAFKKSTRFSSDPGESDIDFETEGDDEVGVIEDLDGDEFKLDASDEKVSGLRLNDSDILADSPQMADQSDLNFDEFDSTTIDGDFKVIDKDMDDDDFAAMMLEDDDEKVVVNTDGDNATSEVSDFTIDKDLDLSAEEISDELTMNEPELQIEDASSSSVEDSDEFSFDFDDDDVAAVEPDDVASMDLDDDTSSEDLVDDTAVVSGSTSDTASDALANELDSDLSATSEQSDNLTAGIGLGAAAAAGVAALGSAFVGGDTDADDRVAELKSQFDAEKSELSERLNKLQSELTAAKADADGLESLQSKLTKTEQAKSELEDKLASMSDSFW